MTGKALVAALVANRKFEIRELPLPDKLPEDFGLLKVRANGVCGTDYEQFTGEMSYLSELPVVPGHEPVGELEWVGQEARAKWGLCEGDRVTVDATVACHSCRKCLRGLVKFCEHRTTYGYIPMKTEHGLWGGMGQYLVLRPNTVMHRIPDNLRFDEAALSNALSAGFEWGVAAAGTGVGDRVLVMGAGQRGIACGMAAAEAGARQVVITGLSRDDAKLALAREFGATHTIDVEKEDLLERVQEITEGDLFDRVIDCTPIATRPVTDAIDAARQGGTIVLAGMKAKHPIPNFFSDQIPLKMLHIRGVYSTSFWAHEQALRVISEHRYPFEKFNSHVMPLQRTQEAIQLLGGETGEAAIHVTIAPWG